ncbi:MAG: ribonuclease T [Acidobacteria bacterium]|nr:ribonuclease T [Acidobacteriota bacterium]
MNTSKALLLTFLLAVVAGVLLASRSPRQRRQQVGRPGAFDYYVLALSWSPEFCHSHPSSPECALGKYGFVVHGLWPQYENGFPENCSTAPGLANPSQVADIIPDVSLVAHEWKTHGTCSGLDAESYFKTLRQAFESVKIPPQLEHPNETFSIAPHEVKKEFVEANRGLQAEDVAVSCGNNYLTGLYVCMDKQLQARGCSGLRDCKANVIKVSPVRR